MQGFRGGSLRVVIIENIDYLGVKLQSLMTPGYVYHCRENRVTKRSLFFVILLGFTQHLIAQPAITSFTPLDGGPGVTVTLKGANFSGATAVSFGGVTAGSFTVVSDSVITAVVGASGASGVIMVTSPQGSTYLPGFSFSTTIPVVTGVFPYTGPVGSEVTIRGGNFDPLKSNDTVFFGGVRAYIISATANSLVVTVPAGAVYAPISVTTTKGLIAFSNPFITVFTSGGNVDSNSFGPFANYIIGAYPYTLTAADFDGDGRTDLAAVVVNTNQVAVLRNTSQPGSINFASPVNFGTGAAPFYVATADFNGDGKPDLAITNQNANTVSVLQNTSVPGTLSFNPKIDFATNALPLNIATADLDGDGKVDMVTVDGNANVVSVFRNTTLAVDSISFAAKVDIGAGGGPMGIALGDLDGDGRPDMVVCDPASNQFLVFRNTSTPGTISFSAGVTYPAGAYPSSASIADLDGDGRPELIISNSSSNNLYVYRNLSSPGTISLAAPVTLSAGSGPSWISISDVNGDGKPDITIADASSNTASVLQNRSTSGNIAFAPFVLFPVGGGPESIVAGDFDGDGRPDMALANYGGSQSTSLSVLHNLMGSLQYPGIDSFAPTSAQQGDTITIYGYHFTGATAVSFGNTAAISFTVVTDSVIRAVVGNGATGLVAVTTPQAATNRGGFRFIYPLPAVSSFSPQSGTTGDTITVKGTHLTGTGTILFGDVAATSFAILSDSVVVAVVGSGASGFVSLTAPGGTDSLAGFVYVAPVRAPPPVLTVFAPASAGTGDTVIIAGRSLDSIRSISFGGVPAQSFTVISDTILVAVVGSGASGDIVAEFSGGADTLPGFSYVAPAPPVLPVFQLLSFTGVSQNGNVLLRWQTEHDSSIAYYVVQYSSDSVSFDGIGSVKAKDADSATYSFTDPAHPTGVSYYRLKIEDTTGGVTLSQIVSVGAAGVPEMLTVFPNPANDVFTVEVPPTTGNSMFELVDMMGNIVVNVPVNAGVTQVTVYVRTLNRGVYKLIWSDGVSKSFRNLLIIRR
jgi:hypothetical protein